MAVRKIAQPRLAERLAAATATLAVLLIASCSRTIEEDEPVELIEHRVEPCRSWCEPMLSPDCGREPGNIPYPSVDECIEACAANPGGWEWARLDDGTDACAEEWFAIADCFDGLTCEEHLSFFRRDTGAYPPGYPCTDEIEARRHCFISTPSLDNPEGGR
jgi:hypothetical protein